MGTTVTTCIKDGTIKNGRSLKELITPIGNNLRILIGIIHILVHANSMAMVALFVTINYHHHIPMTLILNMNINHSHEPFITKHLLVTHIHCMTNQLCHFLVTVMSKNL